MYFPKPLLRLVGNWSWLLGHVADGLADLLAGKVELVGLLQIHPEFRGCPK